MLSIFFLEIDFLGRGGSLSFAFNISVTVEVGLRL